MKNFFLYVLLSATMLGFVSCEAGKNGNSGTVNAQCIGMKAVDLGLSVKWATCNIGADNPEDYGACYACGETTMKLLNNWNTYMYCNGSVDTQTKYCTNSEYGTIIINKAKNSLNLLGYTL